MEIEVQLTNEPIAEQIPPLNNSTIQRFNNSTPTGAWLEFRGVVRGEENGQNISALEYEAYPEMAKREIRRLLTEISAKHPCLAAKVIHRVGVIPAGETAIYVGVAAPHRGEAIALLADFMDRLKQDVPIWKRRALAEFDSGGTGLRPVVSGVAPETTAGRRPSQNLSSFSSQSRKAKFGATPNFTGATPVPPGTVHTGVVFSLNEALTEIQSRCQPLPAVRVPLAEAFGRVLQETVCAPEDMPPFDRSTRDGYAVLQDDVSETFQVVDTLHAADWKPRQLKPGQTVRVATGAALPCENLRVVMHENIERTGDQIRLVRRETVRNVSLRGEDLRAGEPLLQAGAKLDAGALTLLATAGKANPLVSPRLRVVHFTTGDEVIPPDQTPKPGQIRDSNSFLIRGLLQKFPCELMQSHLPENFEQAKQLISAFSLQPSAFDLLLVSGGASVGEKDFTRPLLEWLGFEIVFSQINVRPGRPLIFGVNGNRIAFGLPGNPLSHFVCFHLFVAAALAKLIGEEPKKFQRGRLTAKLDDAPNPRETLWPARWKVGQASCLSLMAEPLKENCSSGKTFARTREPDRLEACPALFPLAWASSGNVTCLAQANALIRVPANCGSIEAGAEVDFWPTNS